MRDLPSHENLKLLWDYVKKIVRSRTLCPEIHRDELPDLIFLVCIGGLIFSYLVQLLHEPHSL
ncbi:hypothetical protein AXF42_Ash007511 [Apostasia shenzhenica]|uniref:Uncharacterized protein n=1 Tax=Apostasia shenzhenica TaxID=1088818 RepID=A0A2I0A5Q1_9ASPA|nr:hypothetical protein AXF42_Ash007511 [Apostasia shenzhenica]